MFSYLFSFEISLGFHFVLNGFWECIIITWTFVNSASNGSRSTGSSGSEANVLMKGGRPSCTLTWIAAAVFDLSVAQISRAPSYSDAVLSENVVTLLILFGRSEFVYSEWASLTLARVPFAKRIWKYRMLGGGAPLLSQVVVWRTPRMKRRN